MTAFFQALAINLLSFVRNQKTNNWHSLTNLIGPKDHDLLIE